MNLEPSPRETIVLDGWWHLAFDPTADWPNEPPLAPGSPSGAARIHPPSMGWEGLEETKESGQIPGAWEQSRPGYHGVAWHWRPIVIPKHWAGRTIRLRFEGARLRAEVFVNHTMVGCDLDGDAPFEIDLTDRVRPGRRYELFVRVTNPGGARPGEPAKPISWGDVKLPPGRDFGGIWGHVSLLATHPAYIADLWATPSANLDGATAHIEVRNRGVARVIGLRAEIRDRAGQWVAEGRLDNVALPAEGAHGVELTVPIASPRLWSLDDPHLYTVAVTLTGADVCDEAQTILGLRRLEVREGDLYLNGQRLPLRAAMSAGWYPGNLAYPSATLAEREVRAARDLGLNALVLHEHPPAPALLDAADRLGLLVGCDAAWLDQGQLPAGGSAFAAAHQHRLEQRDRHHPCLIPSALGRALVLREIAPVAAAPDLPAVARRYGDRILPGSDAERWREQALAWQADFVAYELGRVYADASALCAAMGAAQGERLAHAIAITRRDFPGANLALGAWADVDPARVDGVVDPYRRPKMDAVLLRQAWQGEGVAASPRRSEQISKLASTQGVQIYDPCGLLGGWAESAAAEDMDDDSRPLLIASWRGPAELLSCWREAAMRQRRAAWLLIGDSDAAQGAEELARLCGAEHPIALRAMSSGWMVGAPHLLLEGVAPPGIWGATYEALTPRALFCGLPGRALAIGCAAPQRGRLWRMGSALHIAPLGACELLVCTLPLTARLLANMVAWLTEGTA